MQVFKAFFTVAAKYAPAISIYFIIYACIVFALGLAGKKDMDTKFQSSQLDICVVDEDKSDASHSLYSYLDSIHNIIELPYDTELLQDYLYYRYISYVLVIPDGFEENLQNGETSQLLENVKIPGSTNGQFVDSQIDAYLNSVAAYLTGGFSLKEAFSRTNDTLAQTEEVTMLSFDKEEADMNGYIFYFYQYLPYVFICLLVCGLTPVLVTFRKNGILQRTQCASLPRRSYTLQLALGCIVYSLLIFVIFLLLAVIAYGKSIFQYYSLLGMLNSFVFLLFVVGLTLVVSNFTVETNVLNMISNVVGLGMSFLCGVFVPQYMLADSVLSASRFLPAYWYIRINNVLGGFVSESFEASIYWQNLGIECLFVAAIFVLALLTSKYRRNCSHHY